MRNPGRSSCEVQKSSLQSFHAVFFSPGYCAHEFIVDAKDFKKYGIEAIDIAKRLQDYGKRKPSVQTSGMN